MHEGGEMHFNRWHVGQYTYGVHDDDDIPGVRTRASVWCRVCNVSLSLGQEASHGAGRRHARQTVLQSIPDAPFCPGRAGVWACNCFCRCGRFWPAGGGQRPQLHFSRNPDKVGQVDYDDEMGAGDSYQDGHRRLCTEMATLQRDRNAAAKCPAKPKPKRAQAAKRLGRDQQRAVHVVTRCGQDDCDRRQVVISDGIRL